MRMRNSDHVRKWKSGDVRRNFDCSDLPKLKTENGEGLILLLPFTVFFRLIAVQARNG